MSGRGNCHDNAVIEAFFSLLKIAVADRFASCGEAKMELVDYTEVFYNERRRHSTIGQISPAEFEKRAARRRVDPLENCKERSSHSIHTHYLCQRRRHTQLGHEIGSGAYLDGPGNGARRSFFAPVVDAFSGR